MSSSRQRTLAALRPAMVVGLGLTLLLSGLLSGCGTGQDTQTSSQLAAINGANGEIGRIAVRNAILAFPAEGDKHVYQRGSDAPVLLIIANTGNSEDELTSASSPAAESVAIEGQKVIPAQRTLRAVAEESGNPALQQGEIRMVLQGLTEEVGPGRSVPLRLLFRQAGELNIQVPVAASDEPRVQETH